VLAALAALAGPAVGGPPPRDTLSLATAEIPARFGNKPYELRITVTRSAGKRIPALMLEFVRRVGSATQTHSYTFNVPAGAFVCRGRLANCRLDTGRRLGRFGRIDLTFAATRPARPGVAGANCAAGVTATQRAGLVEGLVDLHERSLSLRAKQRYRRRHGGLAASARTARGTCKPAVVGCHTKIFGLGGDRAHAFALFAPSTGAAEARFYLTSYLPGFDRASVEHAILIRDLPSTSFTIAPDLSSATLDASGLTFLSGSVAYTASRTATQFSTKCGEATATLGGVTGDIAAVFDGVGRSPFGATGGYLENIP
jgi:hypothetical protein